MNFKITLILIILSFINNYEMQLSSSSPSSDDYQIDVVKFYPNKIEIQNGMVSNFFSSNVKLSYSLYFSSNLVFNF
jgi:hypothetical protein